MAATRPPTGWGSPWIDRRGSSGSRPASRPWDSAAAATRTRSACARTTCPPTSTRSTGPASTGSACSTAADTRVAICIDCHGSHDIKKASDPTAKVYPLNVPTLCASCHADAATMEPYGIPTDQFAVYSKSVHGVALLENSDTRAPSCASCHGSHDAKPPRDTEVVEVCGKCHTATQELYMQSRHAELATAAPKCWTCHGTHDVAQPSEALFFHPETPDYQCTTCHDLQTRQLRIELDQFANEADRRCDTCHHPESDIYAQIKAIDELAGRRRERLRRRGREDQRGGRDGHDRRGRRRDPLGGQDEPDQGPGRGAHDEAARDRAERPRSPEEGRGSRRRSRRRGSTRASSGARRW